MAYSVSDTSESASHLKRDRHIVIIGGGIIGVCTAYYLLTHARSPGPEVKVTLVETYVVAGCASGKAGGFIPLDWHGPATASLGRLSWNSFADLAREYDEAQKWVSRPMGAVGYAVLSAKATKNKSSELGLELETSPKVEESEMRPKPSLRE
jgi:glycine/D-amino acid oxidase-like deaminating enzyme